jgi:hypothetical protein
MIIQINKMTFVIRTIRKFFGILIITVGEEVNIETLPGWLL